MTARRVIPRALARQDALDAIDGYLTEGSRTAAGGFVDELERAYRHIGRFPASGSLRHSHELNLPGLRSWPLRRYPYLVFYVERDDHVDVWRVLHGQRDMATWLSSPGES